MDEPEDVKKRLKEVSDYVYEHTIRDDGPTPEELAVLQKFCKHSTVICENSIEFLKVGDKLKYTCDNCQLKLEATPKWDAYVYEDGESQPTSCTYCGCFILKGKEIKEGDEYLHERCLWGDDDNNW